MKKLPLNNKLTNQHLIKNNSSSPIYNSVQEQEVTKKHDLLLVLPLLEGNLVIPLYSCFFFLFNTILVCFCLEKKNMIFSHYPEKKKGSSIFLHPNCAREGQRDYSRHLSLFPSIAQEEGDSIVNFFNR